MYEFAVKEDPPLKVVIGTDAYASIMAKRSSSMRNTTTSTRSSRMAPTWTINNAGQRKGKGVGLEMALGKRAKALASSGPDPACSE
jgi:hypothetical protein